LCWRLTSLKDFSNRQREAGQLASGERQRERQGQLHPSEIMTLVIPFHQSRYRDFKTDYTRYVQVYLRPEFPHLVS
jgi:hypothetical protein